MIPFKYILDAIIILLKNLPKLCKQAVLYILLILTSVVTTDYIQSYRMQSLIDELTLISLNRNFTEDFKRQHGAKTPVYDLKTDCGLESDIAVSHFTVNEVSNEKNSSFFPRGTKLIGINADMEKARDRSLKGYRVDQDCIDFLTQHCFDRHCIETREEFYKKCDSINYGIFTPNKDAKFVRIYCQESKAYQEQITFLNMVRNKYNLPVKNNRSFSCMFFVNGEETFNLKCNQNTIDTLTNNILNNSTRSLYVK